MRVPPLAAVRIRDARLPARGDGAPHGVRHLQRLAAVDPHRHDLLRLRREPEGRVQRLPRPRPPVRHAVREPHGHAAAAHDGEQRPRLLGVRDGLQREDVGPGREQGLDPGAVEAFESGAAHPVPPPVLRAVREHRAVRAHGGRDPPAPRGAGRRDRQGEQLAGAGRVDAVPREALEARLVARRRRDLGAGLGVGAVRLGERGGLVAQQPRRPQRVREAVPRRLQLVRQPAVEDDGPLAQRPDEPGGAGPARIRTVHAPRLGRGAGTATGRAPGPPSDRAAGRSPVASYERFRITREFVLCSAASPLHHERGIA
ncbi:putative homocysteine methyltransferase [Streptomyces sp. Tu6071]|nr:putative homocysteine methyltransferase [Streptomyces sp. Tu6071]